MLVIGGLPHWPPHVTYFQISAGYGSIMPEPRWLESDFSDRLSSVTRAPLIFTAHWEECWPSSQVLIMKNMKDTCGTKCQARPRPHTVAVSQTS